MTVAIFENRCDNEGCALLVCTAKRTGRSGRNEWGLASVRDAR